MGSHGRTPERAPDSQLPRARAAAADAAVESEAFQQMARLFSLSPTRRSAPSPTRAAGAEGSGGGGDDGGDADDGSGRAPSPVRAAAERRADRGARSSAGDATRDGAAVSAAASPAAESRRQVRLAAFEASLDESTLTATEREAAATFRIAFWPLWVWTRHVRRKRSRRAKAALIVAVYDAIRHRRLLRGWLVAVRSDRAKLERAKALGRRVNVRALPLLVGEWARYARRRARLRDALDSLRGLALRQRALALPFLALRAYAAGRELARARTRRRPTHPLDVDTEAARATGAGVAAVRAMAHWRDNSAAELRLPPSARFAIALPAWAAGLVERSARKAAAHRAADGFQRRRLGPLLLALLRAHARYCRKDRWCTRRGFGLVLARRLRQWEAYVVLGLAGHAAHERAHVLTSQGFFLARRHARLQAEADAAEAAAEAAAEGAPAADVSSALAAVAVAAAAAREGGAGPLRASQAALQEHLLARADARRREAARPARARLETLEADASEDATTARRETRKRAEARTTRLGRPVWAEEEEEEAPDADTLVSAYIDRVRLAKRAAAVERQLIAAKRLLMAAQLRADSAADWTQHENEARRADEVEAVLAAKAAADRELIDAAERRVLHLVRDRVAILVGAVLNIDEQLEGPRAWRWARLCFDALSRGLRERAAQSRGARAQLRARLRICARLRYLDRGMPLYYGHKLKRRVLHSWLRAVDRTYALVAPALAQAVRRRRELYAAFSRLLDVGAEPDAPHAVFCRWLEFTQARVGRRALLRLAAARRRLRIAHACMGALVGRPAEGREIEPDGAPPPAAARARRSLADVSAWQRASGELAEWRDRFWRPRLASTCERRLCAWVRARCAERARAPRLRAQLAVFRLLVRERLAWESFLLLSWSASQRAHAPPGDARANSAVLMPAMLQLRAALVTTALARCETLAIRANSRDVAALGRARARPAVELPTSHAMRVLQRADGILPEERVLGASVVLGLHGWLFRALSIELVHLPSPLLRTAPPVVQLRALPTSERYWVLVHRLLGRAQRFRSATATSDTEPTFAQRMAASADKM
jgi:hypothetical protein